MANISHGMNVSEVKSLGTKLQRQYAETIRNLTREMEKLVNNTSGTWVGPDADRFRSWWPKKRANLNAIAEDLQGFGQSALNNAKEQLDTSNR